MKKNNGENKHTPMTTADIFAALREACANDTEALEYSRFPEKDPEGEEDVRTSRCKTIFDLLYYIAESEIIETEDFRFQLEPLDKRLSELIERSGVDRDTATDYEDLVAAFCSEYEKHSFIKGVKTGIRLMMELEEK